MSFYSHLFFHSHCSCTRKSTISKRQKLKALASPSPQGRHGRRPGPPTASPHQHLLPSPSPVVSAGQSPCGAGPQLLRRQVFLAGELGTRSGGCLGGGRRHRPAGLSRLELGQGGAACTSGACVAAACCLSGKDELGHAGQIWARAGRSVPGGPSRRGAGRQGVERHGHLPVLLIRPLDLWVRFRWPAWCRASVAWPVAAWTEVAGLRWLQGLSSSLLGHHPAAGCLWGWLVPWLLRWRPWWRRAPYQGGRCGRVQSPLSCHQCQWALLLYTGVPHGFADGAHGCGLPSDVR
jgi:hypothetical protein